MSGSTSGLARFGALLAVWVLTVIAVISLFFYSGRIWLWVVTVLLVLLAARGLYDLLQTRHTLLRNYPLLGHIRWAFEFLRPFLRQYIVESDLEQNPYSREMRSLIYQRAKDVMDAKPFGTDLDVYDNEYQLLTHSMAAHEKPNPNFRVTIGNEQCSKPYQASVLNVSAMSFGALSAPAIEALNLGARNGGFYHDTGEGGISPYHRKHGGDLVWEIGSGYFGCRDQDGRFDRELFKEQATRDQVKMIEIKLSQGAKPGHGGVLPAAKVTREIAATRKIPLAQDCVSPSYHTAFSSPRGMIEWADSLRRDSGGKPVGIKLCVGHPWEVFAVCKAMLETGIYLDFIVVDGAEGGTGAAPEEFSNHIGVPLREGLLLVRNALVGTGLRKHVRLGASGKVYSAYTMAMNMAIGADWCNAARAFMLTLGCLQTKKCHTDRCPTGVATQNPNRQRGLVVADKAPRVANFHRNTLDHLAEVIAAAGLDHPGELRPHHLMHRPESTQLISLDKIYPFLEENSLLDDPDATPYASWWHAADADSFLPKEVIQPGPHNGEAALSH